MPTLIEKGKMPTLIEKGKIPALVKKSKTRGLNALTSRAADWLSTVCVLCRLGSDDGAVCQQCREAMWLDWQAWQRCWRCMQRISHVALQELQKRECLSLPFKLCHDCRRMPRSWQRAVAVVDYEHPWSCWIHGLKMQLLWQWARPMGELLGQAWNQLQAPRPVGATLWVPIPARPAALKARGFNQASELARYAAAEVPQARLSHALRWQKAAAQNEVAQKWRTRLQRRYDLQRAFEVRPVVRDAQVVLVDDVMTTGYTLQAAALACRRAGARSVWVAVFARVPAPSKQTHLYSKDSFSNLEVSHAAIKKDDLKK